MPAKDLGTKYTCFKCGAKFYDLKKAEPVCPKCGADQRQATAKSAPAAEKRARPQARPPAPEPPEVEAEAEEPETEDEAEDAADEDDDA